MSPRHPSPDRARGPSRPGRAARLLGLVALVLPFFPTVAAAVDPEFRIVARGLDHPWGLAGLPDGRFLVTERPGRMRIVDGDGVVSEPLAGVPPVAEFGQGGLLDVALHPAFDRNGLVYFTHVAGDRAAAGTRLVRARLDGNRLEDVEVLFDMEPRRSGGRHFGSRVRFGRDGRIYFTIGDRGRQTPARDLDDHAGSVIRLNDDGSIPGDNPFLGRADARPEIFAYGVRNAQGLAVHPGTKDLWMHEHGPRGGDEINIVVAGADYGWPEVSHGVNYDGTPVGSGRATADGVRPPLYHWTPSIAPSGMAFHAGDLYVGALRGRALLRLRLDGNRVVGEERLFKGRLGRIRDVHTAPGGKLLLLTDGRDGRLVEVDLPG